MAVKALRTPGAGAPQSTVTITVTDVGNEPPSTPFVTNGNGGIEHESAGELGRAGQHRPAHHRLRLPVYRDASAQNPGRRSRTRQSRRTTVTVDGLDAEHLLRRGGAGDERRGHERLVDFR